MFLGLLGDPGSGGSWAGPRALHVISQAGLGAAFNAVMISTRSPLRNSVTQRHGLEVVDGSAAVADLSVCTA